MSARGKCLRSHFRLVYWSKGKVLFAQQLSSSRLNSLFDPGSVCGYKKPMPNSSRERLDRCWHKARIAARILLREEQGRLTARDVRIGHLLAQDKGVTGRLIDQAIYGILGRKTRLDRESRTAT